MNTAVNREDIVALLEGGPMASGDLAKLLAPQNSGGLNKALRQLAREGKVTRVGAAKQWALTPIANVSPAPPIVSPPAPIVSPAAPIVSAKSTSVPAEDDASEELLTDDELLDEEAEGVDAAAFEADVAPERRARPALRVAPTETVTTGIAWWVGKPQAGFTAEAEARVTGMNASREGKRGRWRESADE